MTQIVQLTKRLFLFAIFFMGICCKKEEPIPVNETELITTIRYSLTPQGGGNPSVFLFKDWDGEGGNEPIITNGTLMPNTIYVGKLELLNEQNNPVENITEQILKESNDHQFFFQSTFENTVSGLKIEYLDQDENAKPLGLVTKITTQSVGDGKLTLTLRHKPDKWALGVSEGKIQNAGGETDLEITFDCKIE